MLLSNLDQLIVHVHIARDEVCRLRIDVKDPRFLVVGPDDGVRRDLIVSATPIVELRDGRDYRVGVFDDAAASRRCACLRQ